MNHARTLMFGVGGTRRPTDILRRERKHRNHFVKTADEGDILCRGIMHSIEKLIIWIGHGSVVGDGWRRKRIVCSGKTTECVCEDRGNARLSLTPNHELLARIFDHGSINSLIDANNKSAGEEGMEKKRKSSTAIVPSRVIRDHHNCRQRCR